MNKKYFGIVLLILATVVVVYFGIRKPAVEPIVDERINSIISEVSNGGVVATSSHDTEIINLIEADIASTEPRTLEITGWKRLSDQPELDFTGRGLEIWIPNEWFANGSIGSEKASFLSLYRWPDKMNDTERNINTVRPYLQDLKVADILFVNNKTSLPEIKSANVLDIIVSGQPAEKIEKNGIQSVIPNKLLYGYPYVEITIYDNYINSTEIFDEMVSRIKIKE